MLKVESLGGPSNTQCRSSESEPTSSGPSSSSNRAESTDTATTEAPGSEEEESDVVPSLLEMRGSNGNFNEKCIIGVLLQKCLKAYWEEKKHNRLIPTHDWVWKWD